MGSTPFQLNDSNNFDAGAGFFLSPTAYTVQQTVSTYDQVTLLS
jgi:hypothetical protein